jgi:hypothetical protein
MNIEHSDLAGLLSQLPGGELLDTVRSKRALVVVGATIVAISAIIIAFQPSFPLVFTGLVLDHEIAPAAKSSFAATHAPRAPVHRSLLNVMVVSTKSSRLAGVRVRAFLNESRKATSMSWHRHEFGNGRG